MVMPRPEGIERKNSGFFFGQFRQARRATGPAGAIFLEQPELLQAALYFSLNCSIQVCTAARIFPCRDRMPAINWFSAGGHGRRVRSWRRAV